MHSVSVDPPYVVSNFGYYAKRQEDLKSRCYTKVCQRTWTFTCNCSKNFDQRSQLCPYKIKTRKSHDL